MGPICVVFCRTNHPKKIDFRSQHWWKVVSCVQNAVEASRGSHSPSWEINGNHHPSGESVLNQAVEWGLLTQGEVPIFVAILMPRTSRDGRAWPRRTVRTLQGPGPWEWRLRSIDRMRSCKIHGFSIDFPGWLLTSTKFRTAQVVCLAHLSTVLVNLRTASCNKSMQKMAPLQVRCGQNRHCKSPVSWAGQRKMTPNSFLASYLYPVKAYPKKGESTWQWMAMENIPFFWLVDYVDVPWFSH